MATDSFNAMPPTQGRESAAKRMMSVKRMFSTSEIPCPFLFHSVAHSNASASVPRRGNAVVCMFMPPLMYVTLLMTLSRVSIQSTGYISAVVRPIIQC